MSFAWKGATALFVSVVGFMKSVNMVHDVSGDANGASDLTRLRALSVAKSV